MKLSLLFAITLVGAVVGIDTVAQDSAGVSRDKLSGGAERCAQTGPLLALGGPVNSTLAEIELTIEAGELDRAIVALDKMDAGAFNPMTKAMIRFYRGYVFAIFGNVDLAEEMFQSALVPQPLPDHFVQDVNEAMAALDGSAKTPRDWSKRPGLNLATIRDKGSYRALVMPPPIYPRRAAEADLGGQVLIFFAITQKGDVDNPRVIEAEPPGYFERAAISWITRAKFRPVMVCGKPTRVEGVAIGLTFNLAM